MPATLIILLTMIILSIVTTAVYDDLPGLQSEDEDLKK